MAYIVKVRDKEFKIDLEKEGRGFKIYLNGEMKEVEVIECNSQSHLYLIVDNRPYDIIIEEVRPQDKNTISVNGEIFGVEVKDEKLQNLVGVKHEIKYVEEIAVTVPMPGLVIEVEVKEGERVRAGQGLVVVEAMKMQNEIKSPRDGNVKRVLVQKGITVNGGDTLVVIE